MAYCPSCQKQMGQTATVCPHCGYDFPDHRVSRRQREREQRTGFAYSGIATLALIVGQIVAAFGCLIAVVGCVMALVQGDLIHAFFFGPIGALLMLAMLVVFARTLDQS